MDEVDSDLEDDLADVMEDSDTEFVVEDEEKDSVEEKIPEKNLDAGLTNEPLHAILIEQDTPKQPNDNGSIKSVINPDQRTSSNPTLTSQNDSQAEPLKEIHWTKSKRYITDIEKCQLNGEVLLDIHELDNPLKIFDKLINLNHFLGYFKSESERYASQKGINLEVSTDELRAFIGINFVMGYHKLPSLRSYWEIGNPSLTVNFIANVMTRDRFKEILSNLHFSNNMDSVPRDHPDHDRAFKVRWLIDYLNEKFLAAVESESEQSVDEHMIKFKGRNIMRQHIKNKPIKWGFKMWYRCAPKIGYLYEFDIYTGKKESTEFGLGESVVLQLTEKLNGSFARNIL